MERKILCALLAVSLVSCIALGIGNGRRAKQIRNMSDATDTALYVDFIMSYGDAVSKIKNYIMWDEEIIPVVTELDSLGYDFARKTGTIEYNLYAIDRNGYWDDTYRRMMEE